MPFLVPFIPLIAAGVGGATSLLASRNQSQQQQAQRDQLAPLINQQTKISEAAGKAGLETLSGAKKDIGFSQDFFKRILEGPPDELLKLFDTAGLTRNIDENEQQLSEQGVRGGRRAAALGQSYFSRDAAINKTLQQLRFNAPTQLAGLAQMLANIGLGEMSTAVGAGAQASNTILNQANLASADADRRNAMIGSIFESIGAATAQASVKR